MSENDNCTVARCQMNNSESADVEEEGEDHVRGWNEW